MDDRQAFKFAFINRCIDAGLTTPEQVLAVAEKAAGFGEVAQNAADLLKTVGIVGGTALAVAPPVVGAALGHMAGRASDVDDFDVAEAKRREVVDEYRRQSERLRREGELRRAQAGLPAPRGPRLA